MPWTHACYALVLLIALTTTATAKNSSSGPPQSDGPVIVDIGFLLSNVMEISEEQETFDFEGVLSLRWQDPRLAFDPAVTGYDQRYYQGQFQFNEVFDGWWPQLILANKAGRLERQGVMLRIQPNGVVHYVEEIDASAQSRLNLRRYPFDTQTFLAIFEVLGFDSSQVQLRMDTGTTGVWTDPLHKVKVPQWHEPSLNGAVVEYAPKYMDGHKTPLTAFQVQIEMSRDPWFTLRLVALPVVIFVMLSWSVFWMDRSSVGDRMDISFIGILTVVAYQIMFSEKLPKISYITVMMSFMIISFVAMCATVLVNMRVSSLDKLGRFEAGDKVDRVCRYLFPLGYALAIIVTGGFIYRSG
ncbi:MAG: hypothetical protein AAF699_02845 [Pseudomonadota bacterium]